jgi:hypothetical protein
MSRLNNLNEAVIDTTKFTGNGGGDLNIRLAKKGAGKSLLDDIEDEDAGAFAPLLPNDIVDTKTIAQRLAEKNEQLAAQTVKDTNRAAELKALMQLRQKKRPEIRHQKTEKQDLNAQLLDRTDAEEMQLQLQNRQLIQDYTEATGNRLPEDTEMVETVEQIEEALDEIPTGDKEVTLADFDIVPTPIRKDKTGYTKTLVTIKKGSVPQEMSALATEVKKLSKGVIRHRIMDMRTIANTNKTQLRGSDLKLGLVSINFKPDGESRVNKGTRFIVSVPEDFQSSRDVVVYIQESRDKTILVLKGNTFSNWPTMQEFLAEAIANYYQYGFASTKTMLKSNGISNPLLAVVKSVSSSGRYTVEPKTDAEGRIEQLTIESKGTDNQWLRVVVLEGQLAATYKVKCRSEIDTNWSVDINNPKGHPLTILDLNGDKFIGILDKLYAKQDWGMDSGGSREYYMLAKLTYRALRDAFVRMWTIVDEPETNAIGLVIGGTLSQKDTAKDIPGSYAAEGIIGKTSHFDYFILTYLAVQELGGDKRNPQEYITTDEYHEKYNIANRGRYQDRPATILKKEGEKRNYHARVYKFQLEYEIAGSKHKLVNSSLDAILEESGLLK